MESDPFPSALVPKGLGAGAENGLETLEEDLVHGLENYTTARKGDHFMCPFQCDLCHYRNIQGSDPLDGSAEDLRLQEAIRRAILDSFWARAPATVEANLREVKRYMDSCSHFGVDCPFVRYLPRGPFPTEDTWGMLAACTLLHRSLDEGRNSDTVQYGTIRKLQTAASNYSNTTPSGTGLVTVAADRLKQRFTSGPTTSLFFSRFTTGCHSRMGDVVIRDRALTIDVLEALFQVLNRVYERADEGPRVQFEVVTLGAACAFGYSAAVRGEEFGHCVLAETVADSKESLDHPRLPHVMVVLRGVFKGSPMIFTHRFALALLSASGVINNRLWLSRLMVEYLVVRHVPLQGPLFRLDPTRNVAMTISQFDALFHKYLGQVQVDYPRILNPQVDVQQEYSFRRSLRRGSTTHARNRAIDVDVIIANNRWRTSAKAGNRDPSLSMLETYTDAVASLDLNLRFSQSL